MLGKLGVGPGSYEVTELLERMRKCFWEDGLVAISEVVLTHVGEAKKCLKMSNLFRDDSQVSELIDITESAVHKGLADYTSRREFLSGFAAADSISVSQRG